MCANHRDGSPTGAIRRTPTCCVRLKTNNAKKIITSTIKITLTLFFFAIAGVYPPVVLAGSTRLLCPITAVTSFCATAPPYARVRTMRILIQSYLRHTKAANTESLCAMIESQ